jgi:hypothetical protein
MDNPPPENQDSLAPQTPAPQQPQVPESATPAPQEPVRPRSDGSELHPFVVLQPGERIVCDIKRHPIGIIGQYIVTGFLIVVALVAALVVGPMLNTQAGSAQASTLLYGGVALLIIFALIFLAVSSYIYSKNQWIITSDSLTQILQPSLFGRQVSQLSLNNLEDITVQQNGILQSMFNYGTLNAETAGERSKFHFIYCPNPNDYARKILAAREDFMNDKRYSETPRPRPE